jgi:shikimate dehydrogenase
MKQFGLIGFPLSHSFSKGYFAHKFQDEGIDDCNYDNFPLENIQLFESLISNNQNIKGLNVTIPYKKEIIPFLNKIDEGAAAVGAVNTIKVERVNRETIIKGYNTDVYGFELSLKKQLEPIHNQALILGTGGAALAVQYVLNKLSIKWKSVSRTAHENTFTYNDITESLLTEYTLIVNTSPLGMYPNVNSCPDLPYHALTPNHYLYDLVYNPEETLFLKKGKEKGCITKNGLEMLHLQAEKAWEIWNSQDC